MSSIYRVTGSIVVALVGAGLAVGGIWLAVLGGSVYFIPLGACMVISALLLLMRKSAGLALYGIVLLATLGWSLWEVGLDWWALFARGGLLVVLGGLMLLPAMVRSLHRPGEAPARYALSSGVLAASLTILCLTGLFAVFQSPHDRAGAFSDARMAASRTVETGLPDGEWHAYGRTPAGRRYSPLDQITPGNIDRLKVAWTYRTGDVRGPDDPGEATYEVTPLMIDGTVFICTPHSLVIALDAVSGREKWRFDPHLKQTSKLTTQHLTCRGVTYFDGSSVAAPAAQPSDGATSSDAERLAASAAEVTTGSAGVPQNVVTGQARPGAVNPVVNRKAPGTGPATDPSCVRRLFAPTSDGRLIALSAATGKICPGFGGDDGTINLWANMPNVTPGSIYATSPPVVTDRLVIVGGTVNDNVATTSPSGVIRAYDVNTGELVWNFDAKNPDATAPIADDRTYSANAPNSWSVSSYDSELGLIYLPMGNQSPDQYGANRSANVEKFSSSILALDAATGKVAWVFQTVHHDLWDMDVPAQPSLVNLTIDGVDIPALVAPTKQGEVYVLNRKTGAPVLPVTEVSAPGGAVKGGLFRPDPAGIRDLFQSRTAARKGHVGRDAAGRTRLQDRFSAS